MKNNNIIIGKIFRISKLFYLYYTSGFFWFRLFGGYGLSFEKSNKQRGRFSERYGYRKVYKFLNYKVEILKPEKSIKIINNERKSLQ